ncbi:uncharacterized protein [Nicotiana sylvestris]|uniref:uncharacterized protein n=1 Tax=Nicotiana sylvestris TaxID=4096 RepID=UPI00388C41AD
MVTLNNVLHVLEIRMNLVSAGLLVKNDFVTFLLENEPQTFKEAISSSESLFWKGAVNSEIESILNNHTCELVDLPPGNKPLGFKWIFKRKMKDAGTIDKFMAGLVVKGYRQRECLDYFDIYSPVTRITSIRMLVALATVYSLEIHQMDVKKTFLNKEITGSSDSKSTSGYVFTIGGGVVSWKSPKQTCISRSTMEAEFIVLDKAGEKAEWIRNFLEDIPFWPKPLAPICIHCDSQAAIGRAESVIYNGKSRHIRRRHKTVWQLLSRGIITIDYIKSSDNMSDPLAKGLTREVVKKSSRGMRLLQITSHSGSNST